MWITFDPKIVSNGINIGSDNIAILGNSNCTYFTIKNDVIEII